jgi:uncharacterized membrane protein
MRARIWSEILCLGKHCLPFKFTEYNFACFVWLCVVISYMKGRTQAERIRELGAEEDT